MIIASNASNTLLDSILKLTTTGFSKFDKNSRRTPVDDN